MQFVSVTSQVSLSTSFDKRVQNQKYKEKPHLSKGKESTYLFGQSLTILLNENFIEEKDYKSMQGKISLFLFLFSVQPIHVISVLVVIKRMNTVWQPRLEIRAKTVKTRVNLVPRAFSLSNMAAAAERQLNVRIDLSDLFAYADFFTG